MTLRLLIATRSAGKRREIERLLDGLPVPFLFPEDVGFAETREEDHLETEDSFEGNARKKAEYFAELSGLPTLGEDSGIEVEALNGAPGVYSKRFAGVTQDHDTANNAELLRQLAAMQAVDRRARYRCAIHFRGVDGRNEVFVGQCSGVIVQQPDGTEGFGYDPLFFSDDLGKTFGRATPEEKFAVSHRGRAFRAFRQWFETHGI